MSTGNGPAPGGPGTVREWHEYPSDAQKAKIACRASTIRFEQRALNEAQERTIQARDVQEGDVYVIRSRARVAASRRSRFARTSGQSSSITL